MKTRSWLALGVFIPNAQSIPTVLLTNVLDPVLVGDSGNVEARNGTVVNCPHVVADFHEVRKRVLEGEVLSVVPFNCGDKILYGYGENTTVSLVPRVIISRN